MGDRMKVLKTICLIIFKLVLFIGVMCLLLSFSMKKLVINSVSSIVVNNNETIQMLEDVGIEREKVQEFVENKKTQEFITSYINPIFEGNVDLENVNIGEDLLVFVKENQSMIEDLIGQPLPMEEIEAYATSENIEKVNEVYKEAVVDVQEDMPSEVKKTVSTFSYFVSNQFRLGVLVICLVAILIIVIMQRPIYTLIKTIGNTLTWCGLLVGGVTGFGSLLITSLFSDMNYTFDFSNGIYSSLISFGSGILFLIIYMIVKKKIKCKENRNEIS